MISKNNKVSDKIDSASVYDKTSLQIDKKKSTENKRKILSKNIEEALKDIENGDYITGNYKDVIKAIDDEIKSDKKIR